MFVLADALADATISLAVVTAGLAVGTFVLARITHQGNEGARQAEAKQLAASYRPVLVPYQRSGEHVAFRGGQILAGTGPKITENPPDRPDLPRYSAAFLPVENVGTGPALNVRGTYQGPRGKGRTQFPVEAIGGNERGVVPFESWTGDSLDYSGSQEVSAVIEYDDVAGHTYRTRITFDSGNNAYRATLDPD